MAEALDPVTKELVGVGAAIAGHCQPCFDYHYREAVRLGAPRAAIEAAVGMARAVRGAGDQHRDEFAARRMAKAPSAE